MNTEDREKLLDVAGFLQGWLAFKKPVPTDEVVRLHFDLVMEVLAKNNEVLDLVSYQRELLINYNNHLQAEYHYANYDESDVDEFLNID